MLFLFLCSYWCFKGLQIPQVYKKAKLFKCLLICHRNALWIAIKYASMECNLLWDRKENLINQLNFYDKKFFPLNLMPVIKFDSNHQSAFFEDITNSWHIWKAGQFEIPVDASMPIWFGHHKSAKIYCKKWPLFIFRWFCKPSVWIGHLCVYHTD